MLLAIDPGPEECGYVEFRDGNVLDAGNVSVDALLLHVEQTEALECALEYTPPYVMKTQDGRPYVPEQIMTTAMVMGRIQQVWYDARGDLPALINRKDVRKELTGKASHVGDTHVRQALLELYGGDKSTAVGIKAKKGPLYGVSRHAWAALGVAVVHARQREPAF